MIDLINVDYELPEDGEWVCARYTGGNHKSRDSKGKHLFHVVKFHKGITLAEREELKADGKERALIYESFDEKDNNKRPYNWQCFGASKFFGQDIDVWFRLPEIAEPQVKDYQDVVFAGNGIDLRLIS